MPTLALFNVVLEVLARPLGKKKEKSNQIRKEKENYQNLLMDDTVYRKP